MEAKTELKTHVDLNITPKASEELKKLMTAQGKADQALRVSVLPGGCSGFQYGLSFAAAPSDGEVVIEQAGVKLIVHEQDVEILNGIKLDYIDTLMGGGFKISNPNATESCGCGKSFR
ncbi:MAG: iron-sulfur cluster assembly accessory protein [Euryarchaeota archaeon]|nr:iron-sulfur cluster assembly accessory protein [Euryarchaeota archaeon]